MSEPDRPLRAFVAAPTKPALHHSMLAMLSKCAEMVRWRYIEGIKAPPGVALVVGTAVHRAAEADLGEKMRTGKGLPLQDVKDKARDALLATWEGEQPLLDEEERTRGIAVVRGEALDKSVNLSALHSREITPIRKPTHLERKLRVELRGFPYDLEGSIDVQEGDDLILDRKTSSKSPSGDEVEGHPQLETYAFMKSVVDGKPVKRVGLDFLVQTESGKTKAVPLIQDAPLRFDAIVARVERAAKVLESGAFMPVDPTGPSGWVCSPKWCGYFDRCVFGRARKTSHTVS